MKTAASEKSGKSMLETLFDEMFGMAVDDDKQPIYGTSKQSGGSSEREFRKTFHPMDAVMLLKGPLTELCSSGSPSNNDARCSEARACLERLSRCEELVVNSNRENRRLTADELAFINSCVADVQALLNTDLLDDTNWGGNVPAPLLLKGIVGGVDVAEIEAEEVFMVRGASYLQDNEKCPAEPPLFHMRGMQVVEQPKGVPARAATKVALQDWCAFPKSRDTCNEWLIVNYMVPGATTVNVVCLYTASRAAREVIQCLPCQDYDKPNPSTASGDSPRSTSGNSGGVSSSRYKTVSASDKAPLRNAAPWANCLYRFWGGSDEYRNKTFKLFPRMCKSSWAIQAAVGRKPALIGNNKLELTYTRGRNYLEIDIDLSSSSIATHILGMVRGVSKHMVVDLGIGIEGTREDELPEAIVAQTRFDRVGLDGCASVPATA